MINDGNQIKSKQTAHCALWKKKKKKKKHYNEKTTAFTYNILNI